MTKVNNGIDMEVTQERQVNILNFCSMAILGCYFDINFGETLAPGSSLSNILRTCINGKFYSIMVESNVKSIWQHNLPMDFYDAVKMPSRRLDFWCLKGKK